MERRRAHVVAEATRAEQGLRAAEVLLGLALYGDAISRAYFAALHQVRAALFTQGIRSGSRAATHHLFDTRIVGEGVVAPPLRASFARLRKAREQMDYGTEVVPDEEDAAARVAEAREIIAAIGAWLVAKGWIDRSAESPASPPQADGVRASDLGSDGVGLGGAAPQQSPPDDDWSNL